MYYHCRDLKHVMCGKVYPPPSYDDNKEWLADAYRWLGHHCGYFPQVWLSRSRSMITGYRIRFAYTTKTKLIAQKEEEYRRFNKVKIQKLDRALFGFNIMPGNFPIDFDMWETILGSLIDCKSFEQQNKNIVEMLERQMKWCKEDKAPLDVFLQRWIDCDKNLDIYLKKYLFIESDQVVVPSLNLKAAKKIICCNEKQKKTLRKMGFIEDRIEIRNIKSDGML